MSDDGNEVEFVGSSTVASRLAEAQKRGDVVVVEDSDCDCDDSGSGGTCQPACGDVVLIESSDSDGESGAAAASNGIRACRLIVMKDAPSVWRRGPKGTCFTVMLQLVDATGAKISDLDPGKGPIPVRVDITYGGARLVSSLSGSTDIVRFFDKVHIKTDGTCTFRVQYFQTSSSHNDQHFHLQLTPSAIHCAQHNITVPRITLAGTKVMCARRPQPSGASAASDWREPASDNAMRELVRKRIYYILLGVKAHVHINKDDGTWRLASELEADLYTQAQSQEQYLLMPSQPEFADNAMHYIATQATHMPEETRRQAWSNLNNLKQSLSSAPRSGKRNAAAAAGGAGAASGSGGAGSAKRRKQVMWQRSNDAQEIAMRVKKLEIVKKYVQSLPSSKSAAARETVARASRFERMLYEKLPTREDYKRIETSEDVRAALSKVVELQWTQFTTSSSRT